jgi:hypothetical protein
LFFGIYCFHRKRTSFKKQIANQHSRGAKGNRARAALKRISALFRRWPKHAPSSTLFGMDDKFRREVTDDLWKSGFGSELKALKVFEGREDWSAITGTSFFDPVHNVSRELDFTAHKHRFRQREDGEFLFNVTVSLVAEVKKSERPWAVLRSSPWRTPELPFLMNAIIRSAPDMPESEIQTAFAKGCIISANKWFGHGVHEVFKKPNEHGRWFNAAAKTCRASIAESQEPRLKFQDSTWVVEYIQPLVVLDGNLLSVALDEKKEVLLENIPFASVRFEERGRQSTKAFVVDLVALEALHSYIELIDCGFEHCFNLLGEYRPS